MYTLQVRTATRQDFAAACRLYDDVVADNSGSEYDVLWRRDLHPSDASILAAVEADTLYVAFDGEDLIGAAIVNDDFAAGYDSLPWRVDAAPGQALCLHLFCVHPTLAGRGIGTRFLQLILEDCRRRGIKSVRLDVFAHNKPARHLYEKVGFSLQGITRLTYEDQSVCTIDFALYEYVL